MLSSRMKLYYVSLYAVCTTRRRSVMDEWVGGYIATFFLGANAQNLLYRVGTVMPVLAYSSYTRWTSR
jgi:hypothetical protein